MPLSEDTVPYELLFRFEPDGTIRGAHFQLCHRITKDGAVISANPLAPEPVMVGIAKAGVDPDIIKKALDASMQLTIENMGERIAEQKLAIEKHEAEIASMVESHSAELAAKDANTQQLLTQIERLTIIVDTFREETTTADPVTATVEVPADAKPAE